jgi:uncharacterized protein
VAARSQLIVPLTEIPTQRRIELGPDFIGAAVEGLPMHAALEAPAGDPDAGTASAEIELHAGSPGFFARGSIKGWVAAACGRCVNRVEVAIDEDIAVTFLPGDQLPDNEAEDDDDLPAEDDVDLYPYEGEAIDLAPLLRERVIMALPFSPLCAEDCKGLCSVCGADLNAAECGCDRSVIDPRLAALKNIKA